MSTFKAESSNEIKTSAIFPETSSSTLLALLQDLELLIRLNPLVSSFTRLPPFPSASPSDSDSVEYSVTDSIPVFFGLLTSSQTYTALFTPTTDGQRIDISAGWGISTKSVWSVESNVGKEGTEGSKVTETSVVTVSGGRVWSALIKGFVEGQIRQSHGVLMDRLKERVQDSEATS